jgi:hypothetical protein
LDACPFMVAAFNLKLAGGGGLSGGPSFELFLLQL